MVLYTLCHVLALQALSLSELLNEQAGQGEHCSGSLQDFGPPLCLLVVDGSHLHRQAVALSVQITLPLRTHLLHHLPTLGWMYLSHLVRTQYQSRH